MKKGFGPMLYVVIVGNGLDMLFYLYLVIMEQDLSKGMTIFTSYLFVVYFCYILEDAYCGLREMIIIAR